MATLALIEEGFDVALPSFKQPSFDMISKWGSALHTIQIKKGCFAPNCKTVQWKTTKHKSGLYSADDCRYFGLVLIPRNSIWWLPFSAIRGKHSVCTNIEHELLAQYRGNLDGLKKCH